MTTRKTFWSNCFVEAIKAKIKYGNTIDLIYISPKKADGFAFVPHWMWYDKIDGNVYDFHTTGTLKHFWNVFWWKGFIRIQPVEIFNRWYRTVGTGNDERTHQRRTVFRSAHSGRD